MIDPMNKTPEQIQNSIKAAFDSVNLINGVVAGTAMVNDAIEEKTDTVERNVTHLEIMLTQEWFTNALTVQQTTDINNCISNGNNYLAQN